MAKLKPGVTVTPSNLGTRWSGYGTKRVDLDVIGGGAGLL